MTKLGHYTCDACGEEFADVDTDGRTGPALLAEHMTAEHPNPSA